MAKVDLHVHCSERSSCAVTTEEEQVKAAIAAGLDGIAFTDHYRLPAPERLAELNKKYAPFKIYPGIELTVEHEDWLVIGLNDPELESEEWAYPELHAYVRSQDGFLVLAHPFRFRSEILADIWSYPPDAIEVHSHNTPPAKEGEIRRIAAQLGLAALSNSDAHKAASLGPYYNELPGNLDGAAGLVRALLGLKK
jgi:histidinol phosphatase-like PHP family hydrolase